MKSVTWSLNSYEKLNIKTGFIKLYRYNRTIKNTIIGVYERKNPDEGNAFIDLLYNQVRNIKIHEKFATPYGLVVDNFKNT